MPRETWVYPADGSPPYLKGSRPEDSGVWEGSSPMIAGDLPDFVSPVDGKTYSGRAGLREHNRRNGVVPMEDLKGLPHLTINSDFRTSSERKQDAQRRKELIIQQVNKHAR